MNVLLTSIPTKNTTKLNDLIYKETKLICEKLGVPQKTTDRKLKPGWGIQIRIADKKIDYKQKY